jgi:hypothetical protein
MLNGVILENLRRAAAMAKEHTLEFAARIGSRRFAEI